MLDSTDCMLAPHNEFLVSGLVHFDMVHLALSNVKHVVALIIYKLV